jgi:DNA-binding FadR family transcriptional regulator
MPFQAIEAQRLYQQVAEQVAGLIRSGELPAGTRLPPERDLAQRLGVSRPTLREAMVALEIAGFVEVRTGSGIYVRRRTAAAEPALSFDAGPGAFDLLGARLLIEPEIAASAAVTASPADIRRLDETVAALEEAPDHRASQHADCRFHALIAEATRNSVLVSIVEGLWAHMFSPIFETLSLRTGLPESRRMTLADHAAIVAAIKAGDAGAAREAMRRHLENVRAILSTGDGASRPVRGSPSRSRKQAARPAAGRGAR